MPVISNHNWIFRYAQDDERDAKQILHHKRSPSFIKEEQKYSQVSPLDKEGLGEICHSEHNEEPKIEKYIDSNHPIKT